MISSSRELMSPRTRWCLHSFAVVKAHVRKHGGRSARVGLVAAPAEGRQGGDGGERRVRTGLGPRGAERREGGLGWWTQARLPLRSNRRAGRPQMKQSRARE